LNEETIVKTKGEVLKDFLLKKYKIGKDFWKPYQENWADIKTEYVGVINEAKEDWQGNVIVPTLKKVVRNLVSLYLSMLLSKGAESFDLGPGEESDKKNAENLRLKMVYDLNTMEVERKMIPILQDFVLYGYAVGYVPWRHTVDKMRTGKKTVKDVVTFDGPDLECADLQKLVSDPNCKDLSSWKIYEKDDVPITYLKQKEKDKIYFNIDALKESIGLNVDVVDTLEYHGLVPKRLIEGQIDDPDEPNPFDDEYVQAIIVLAHEDTVIRACAYPYWCNNIFVPFVNDHMVDEIVGMGSGDDIKALAPMLTNLYNKLTDLVNIVTNPAYEMAVNRYLGRAKTILMRPGRVLPVKELGTIREISTTAQASTIQLIPQLISMINGIIEEITGATPQIVPTGDKKDVHGTATGLAMMTEKSMQPINTKCRFYIEPAFKKVLGIIYRHNIQYYKKEKAARILGEKKANEFKLDYLKKSDIMLTGNPDFIPTGISGFMEKKVEIKNLIDFATFGAKYTVPATGKDLLGNDIPINNPDGSQAMKTFMKLEVVIRRIGELLKIKDLDELIPEEEKKSVTPQTNASQPPPQTASRSGEMGRNTPAVPSGGNYLARGMGGQAQGVKGE